MHGEGSNIKTFGQLILLLFFIAGGAAIFIPFGANVFDWHLETRSFILKLEVPRVTGVERHTQLVMMGETIGDVATMKHMHNSDGTIGVLLTLNINPKKAQYLTDRTLFYVTQRNFIGLTIIEAVPQPGGTKIVSGDRLIGYPPFDIGEMGGKIELMAATIKGYQRMIDPQMIDDIKEIAQKSEILGTDLQRYLPHYRRVLKKQLVTLQTLKKKLTLTPKDLVAIQRLKRDIPKVLHQTKKGLKLMDKALDTGETAMDLRDDLLITYHNSMKKIDGMIITTKQLQKRVERMIPVVNSVITWLDVGLGSIGMLLHDPTIYNDSQLIFKMMKQSLHRYLIPTIKIKSFNNRLR